MSHRYIGTDYVPDIEQKLISGDGTDEYDAPVELENASSALVFINGSIQRPEFDYTIGNGKLTFEEAVAVGQQIIVTPLVGSTTTVAPTTGSITVSSLSNDLIATQGDFDGRERDDVFVTPALMSNFVFMKYWKIDNIPVVAGAQSSHPNLVGEVPKYIRVCFRCIANSNGYLAGEVMEFGSWRYTAQSWGQTGLGFLDINDTAVVVKFGNTRVPVLPNPLTGDAVTITAANFVGEVHLFS